MRLGDRAAERLSASSTSSDDHRQRRQRSARRRPYLQLLARRQRRHGLAALRRGCWHFHARRHQHETHRIQAEFVARA